MIRSFPHILHILFFLSFSHPLVLTGIFWNKEIFWMPFCLIIESTQISLFNLWSAIHSSLFSSISDPCVPIIPFTDFTYLSQTSSLFKVNI